MLGKFALEHIGTRKQFNQVLPCSALQLSICTVYMKEALFMKIPAAHTDVASRVTDVRSQGNCVA